MGKIKFIIFPLALSVAAGIIYLYTAAPFMFWLDAGDMIAAAKTLGVNNPPAPFYISIAHLFTLLPFGSVIFRLQLFSALLASISLFLLYQITVWVVEQDQAFHKPTAILAGVFSMLSMAFSYEFWSQAQNTDRFIFAVCIELVVLYSLLVLPKQKNINTIAFVIFFLLGLALGIDPVVVSFFPAVLLIVLRQKQLLSVKKLLLLGLAGVGGIVVVMSYLPFASLHTPFLNYQRPTTVGAIWSVITGQGLSIFSPTTGHVGGFTGSWSVFVSSSQNFLKMIWISFTPVLIPFMLLGGWYLWKIRKDLFFAFLLIILTNFVLSDLYLSGNQESWYILSDAILALFAGVGFVWIVKKMHYQTFVFVLVVLSLSPFVYWLTALNRHTLTLTEDYIHNVYTPIKGPAILFGSGDLFVDTSYYVYDVSQDTTIIPVIDNEFYLTKSYRENLQQTTALQIPDTDNMTFDNQDEYSRFINNFFAINLPKYKIYIDHYALSDSFILNPDDDNPNFTLDTKRFKLIPEGLVEEVVLKKSRVTPNITNFAYQFTNEFPEKKPTMFEHAYNTQLAAMIDEYAFSYNALGDYYENNKNSTNAFQYYQKAYTFDTKNTDTLNRLGLYYGNKNNYKQALEYFLKAEAIIPTDPQIAYNIGIIYLKTGDKNKAKSWFTKTLSLANGDSQISEEVSNALDYLDNKSPSNTTNNSTSSTTVSSWQTFKNTQMNVTFTYPPEYDVQSLGTNLIGLFASGQGSPTITFYSEEVASNTNLDTYAKTFPYAIKGKFIASKDTPIDGFDQAESYEYQTGTNETELVLMEQKNQIIALIIPLTRLDDQTFGDTLTQIVQSTNLLH